MGNEQILSQINLLGYDIFREGNTLRGKYRGRGIPPQQKLKPLLKALKIHREQDWKPKENRGILIIEELPDEIRVIANSEENRAFDRKREKVFREANRRLREMIIEAGGTSGKPIIRSSGKN